MILKFIYHVAGSVQIFGKYEIVMKIDGPEKFIFEQYKRFKDEFIKKYNEGKDEDLRLILKNE